MMIQGKLHTVIMSESITKDVSCLNAISTPLNTRRNIKGRVSAAKLTARLDFCSINYTSYLNIYRILYTIDSVIHLSSQGKNRMPNQQVLIDLHIRAKRPFTDQCPNLVQESTWPESHSILMYILLLKIQCSTTESDTTTSSYKRKFRPQSFLINSKINQKGSFSI